MFTYSQGLRMQSTNDIELLQLIKSADESAFVELHDRYHRVMFLEARNRLESEDEAKDAVQEIFMWVWEKRHKINIQHSFRAYLLQAIRFHCSKRIQAESSLRKKQKRYSEGMMEIFTSSLPVENKELNQQIRAAMEKVSPARRAAFKKVYLDGKSLKEVAEELGISIYTAKNNIINAVKTLRENLKNLH